MPLRVDIAVFAHNEAAGIAAMLRGLLAQDIFTTGDISARVLVLANGCTDDTVRQATMPGAEVADLAEAGKSRTWNRFVHGLSAPECGVLIFCDADITLPRPDSLTRLALALAAGQGPLVMNSQPVKDIAVDPRGLTALDRIIAAAGGGLDDWKTAICGQLYAMPAGAARRIHLPIGLPVEDGFLRAMVLTDALTGPEDFARIDGLEGLFHIYASERSIAALIRHQTRIVIGSAINAACFAHLRGLPAAERLAELARAANDDGWLARVMGAQLPRWYGYVPLHFATRRLTRLVRRGQTPGLRAILLAIPGFGFDLIVYLNAQIRMAFGTGAGHW